LPPSVAPQTWHHGLVARWWAEFNRDGPEIDYFRRFVEAGQPALDVGCGSGRLLLPFLRAGLDVDGCDVSADMVALCREQAEREGLSPILFVQPMHELAPPRRYRTIMVCGAFGLGSTRAQDREALARFFEHLEPGGTLVLDHEVPYSQPRRWRQWLAEERRALPEEWPPPGERRRGSDGAEYELRVRAVDLDPLRQCLSYELRATMWRDGKPVAEEEHALTLRLYLRNELLLLLEGAGFVDVDVRGDHTEEEATADHDFLVFVARKPERA
jgi:SAM-dependent methyltransferase